MRVGSASPRCSEILLNVAQHGRAARGRGLEPLDQRFALFERSAHDMELRVQFGDVLLPASEARPRASAWRSSASLSAASAAASCCSCSARSRARFRLQLPHPRLLGVELREQILLARSVQLDAFGDLTLQRRLALAALTDHRLAVSQHRLEDVAAAFEVLQVLAETLGERACVRQIGLERAQAPRLRLAFLERGTGRRIVRFERGVCSRGFLACGLEVGAQPVALSGNSRVFAADRRILRLELGDAAVAQPDLALEHRQLLALAIEQLLELAQVGRQIAEILFELTATLGDRCQVGAQRADFRLPQALFESQLMCRIILSSRAGAVPAVRRRESRPAAGAARGPGRHPRVGGAHRIIGADEIGRPAAKPAVLGSLPGPPVVGVSRCVAIRSP